MDRESNISQCPSADCMDGTSKSFQLQTGSARNSDNFKSKSADIFGSLEVIEQKYESETKSFSAVDDDEGGDKEERRSIERGCIFRKPKRSLYDSLSGKTDLETNKDRDHPGHYSSLVSKSNPPVTEAKQPVRSTSQSSTQDTKTIFRKPGSHPKSKESKEEMTTYTNRSPGWSRGQRHGTWNGRPRGGRSQPPDHLVNPQKYTKYSLRETNMCGNAANRSIALGFLNDLQKRKESELKSSTEVCEEGKHVFQKPVLSKEPTEQSPKKRVYGSVYKMADYEVGMSSSVQKPKKLKLMDSLKQQTDDPVLDHLSDNTETHIVPSEDSVTQEESLSNQSEQDKESSFKSRTFKQRKRFRERTDND